MTLRDDQITLLATATSALHTWQETASNVDVVLQQVTMYFPSDQGEAHQVVFTWDDKAERFTIST